MPGKDSPHSGMQFLGLRKRSCTQCSQVLCTFGGASGEVESATRTPSVFTRFACVGVGASGSRMSPEVQVSLRPRCCFKGGAPGSASEGGDFLTFEHCDPFIVQRTLTEQHFGLFVCLCFLEVLECISDPFSYSFSAVF